MCPLDGTGERPESELWDFYANAFLDALDPKTDVFDFQTFDDAEIIGSVGIKRKRRNQKLTRHIRGTYKACRVKLRALNKQGAGIYVNVNRIKSGARTAENVDCIRAIWADFDEGVPNSWALQPSLFNHTSLVDGVQKGQALWIVNGNLSTEEHKGMLERIVRDLGACPGALLLNQVLRVPGFHHMKNPANPQLVTPVFMYGESYTPEQLRATYPPLPKTINKGHAIEQRDVPLFEPDLPQSIAEARTWLSTAPVAREGKLGGLQTVKTAMRCKGLGISEETCFEIMTEDGGWNERCEPPWDLEELQVKVANGYRYAKRPLGAESAWFEFQDVIEDIRRTPQLRPRPLLDPREPWPTAQKMLELNHTLDDLRTLHHDGNDFLRYVGTHYERFDDMAITAAVWKFLQYADRLNKEGNREHFKPTTAKVNNAFNALRAVTYLDAVRFPCWLPGAGHDRPPADEILPCSNGLLHIPTRKLLPSTPEYLGLNALPYSYDPLAGEPKEWLTFLKSLWGDDAETIGTLQEWFGYALTQDTRYQKILLLIGPRRSGKGTIGRVLREMLGAENVAGPTLSSLSGPFGLEPLLFKQLAAISDARLSSRSDASAIAERLLAISGEDAITIDRKFKTAWHGRLPIRFMLLTNETPKITDAAAALASRFIILKCTESFLGREDHGLEQRLLAELPGILNWSLEGLDRLNKRKRFIQPRASAEVGQELEDLASPVMVFVRERCVVSPTAQVDRNVLFNAWSDWSRANGRQPGEASVFGRNLSAAVPGLKRSQPREGDDRKDLHVGIGLLLHPDFCDLTTPPTG